MSENNKYKYLQIFKGNCLTKLSQRNFQKVITFDLDETLGSFADLNILWSGLNQLRKNNFENNDIEQTEFNKLLDIFPEFLRFGILNILEYLYIKKKQRECDNIYIYTNNNCTPPWVNLITNYINYKLKCKDDIFDKAICAFKINNKILEVSRTTRDKTYNDFIKCTLLPESTEICFVDNTYYQNMVHDKIYFIQPRSYYHNLNMTDIIERFLKSPYGIEFMNLTYTSHNIKEFLYDWFDLNGGIRSLKTSKNIDIEIFVSQKIMFHIKEFFYLTNRKIRTKKAKWKLNRVTRKFQTILISDLSNSIVV